jgi:hypothetical protein
MQLTVNQKVKTPRRFTCYGTHDFRRYRKPTYLAIGLVYLPDFMSLNFREPRRHPVPVFQKVTASQCFYVLRLTHMSSLWSSEYNS